MARRHHQRLGLHHLVASDTEAAEFLHLFSDETRLNFDNLPEVVTLGLCHSVPTSHELRSAWAGL